WWFGNFVSVLSCHFNAYVFVELEDLCGRVLSFVDLT
ncbi:hypothetical protein Leryth_024507, partial [Lithospermum erythrorhizon]